MAKGSIGYSEKSGSPSGAYGLEKGLEGMEGFSGKGIGSGMVYMVIGIGYSGNPNELAQGLHQYLSVLSQYLGKQPGNYGKSPQKYDATSLKGFFEPYNGDMGICEICRSPTPRGLRRCPSCSSAMRGI